MAKTTRLQGLFVLLSFITCSVAGYWLRDHRAPPTRMAVDAESSAEHLVSAGLENPFSAVISLGSAGAHVELENKTLGDKVKINYALELVSDTGAEMCPPQFVGPVDVNSAAPKHAKDLALPSTIPDGYYVLRLSAAAKGDKDQTSTIAETYAKCIAGKLSIVDSNEYFSKSRANAGVRL